DRPRCFPVSKLYFPVESSPAIAKVTRLGHAYSIIGFARRDARPMLFPVVIAASKKVPPTTREVLHQATGGVEICLVSEEAMSDEQRERGFPAVVHVLHVDWLLLLQIEFVHQLAIRSLHGTQKFRQAHEHCSRERGVASPQQFRACNSRERARPHLSGAPRFDTPALLRTASA